VSRGPQPRRLHADEVVADEPLVRRLLAAQLPGLAGLPLRFVVSDGTDNVMWRLGEDLVVRLPRIANAAADVAKEQATLPALAPYLPLRVPVPVAQGRPDEGYPFPWSVYEWLPGRPAALGLVDDPERLATDLADLVRALRSVPPDALPPTEAPASYRRLPLATRDQPTRAAIAALDGEVDGAQALAAWESALAVPQPDRPEVWLHNDIKRDNLLCHRGRLTACIDWGGLCRGDPSVDLIIAWDLLTPTLRPLFRERVDVDDATWAHGRGWALSLALIALDYYRVTNPGLAAASRHQIAEVLSDHASGA
jgi:aminoglycoside phosphotransferase (APT) family kinase protein